ncbi:hypothetical protein [Comamonas sp. NLF-1-9]|nr:hypothetical protein [Comamonas sp. NLF-1-9]QXL83938.1 hypothetical protein KUD94_11940 [Comamonas sp. NLF-1-9]
MSEHTPSPETAAEVDPIESVTTVIPFIIPMYGAMLIFILAMIAITVG